MTQGAGLDIEGLRRGFGGVVALPGSPDYDEAVAIWNGAITRRPAIVARCRDAKDVSAALQFARDRGLEVSVRGGGHGFAGFALCEQGLMIDLSLQRNVQVDASTRRARCGAGTRWSELDAAAQEHGLAVPGGFISHTGVAGLTLGGGFGWLTRKAGLSCDNLVSAEVVTADGRILHVSADEHSELFWALRGGGGNFGVVTQFEFQLTPVGPLLHLGLFFFTLDQGAHMLRFAREFTRGLPDECSAFMAALNAPPAPFVPEAYHFQPLYALALVDLKGGPEHAARIQTIRSTLAPSFELVTPIPYVALQQMFDGSATWGMLAYEKAVYLDELGDAAIDVIVQHVPKKASPLSFMPIFVLGGAFARIAEDAAAFGGSRKTRFIVNIAAMAPSADLLAHDTAWSRAFWSALVPHARDRGGYVNFMTEYEADRVRAAYGAAKYARLARIKAQYDPANVFHLNANIEPSRSS